MSLFSMPTLPRVDTTKANTLIGQLRALHTDEADGLVAQIQAAESGHDLKTFYELATKAQRLLHPDTAAALQSVPAVRLFGTPPVTSVPAGGPTVAQTRLEGRLLAVASHYLNQDGRGSDVTFVSPSVEEVHAEHRAGRI